jgi:hypothetical protein
MADKANKKGKELRYGRPGPPRTQPADCGSLMERIKGLRRLVYPASRKAAMITENDKSVDLVMKIVYKSLRCKSEVNC